MTNTGGKQMRPGGRYGPFELTDDDLHAEADFLDRCYTAIADARRKGLCISAAAWFRRTHTVTDYRLE